MKNLIYLLFVIILLGCSQTENKTISVSDMNLSLGEQEMGDLSKNQTLLESPIVMAGETYEIGVGIIAPAKLLIELNGSGVRFEAIVGPCEMNFPGFNPDGEDSEDNKVEESAAEAKPDNIFEQIMKSTMQFFVIGDKEILWSSDEMKRKDEPQKVDVDISGVKKLALVAVAKNGHSIPLKTD